MASAPASSLTVPPDLVGDILAGRCVAFVGAGFSAPAVKPWKDLLGLLAGKLGSRGKDRWVDEKPANNDYGMDLLRGAGCEIVRLAGVHELQPRRLHADLLLAELGHRADDSAVAFDVLGGWARPRHGRPSSCLPAGSRPRATVATSCAAAPSSMRPVGTSSSA